MFQALYLVALIIIGCLFSPALIAQAKKTIYIYNDEGVSPHALQHTLHTLKKVLSPEYLIRTIPAVEVQAGTWKKDAILFIMPGGADLPYVQKLAGDGNQQIEDYVRTGGSYVGLCAGAYYASSYVEFDKNGPLEVIGKRALGFFPGTAIGPVLAPYDYQNNSGARAAVQHLRLPIQQTTVYYNGGGYFAGLENHPTIQVLGYYSNHLPSIIWLPYHQGKVLLSGVHFEYDPELLDPTDLYLSPIIHALQKEASSRTQLTHTLFTLLGLKTSTTHLSSERAL